MTEMGLAKMQDTAHAHSQALGKTRIINLAGEYKVDRWKFKAGIARTSIPAVASGAVLKHPQLMIPQRDQMASFLTVAAWGVQYDLTHKVALNLSHYAQWHQQRQSDVLLSKDKRTVMSTVYHLSKRTDLYSLLEWRSNRAGIAENNRSKNQQSLTAGLRHRF
ncbi:MAG: porin [Polynucleobacter sp.]|nr:MAG: porin [Polynucleobacter sp.]